MRGSGSPALVVLCSDACGCAFEGSRKENYSDFSALLTFSYVTLDTEEQWSRLT